MAILLAAQLPQINLVGLSTVHGNGSLAHTTRNHLTQPNPSLAPTTPPLLTTPRTPSPPSLPSPRSQRRALPPRLRLARHRRARAHPRRRPAPADPPGQTRHRDSRRRRPRRRRGPARARLGRGAAQASRDGRRQRRRRAGARGAGAAGGREPDDRGDGNADKRGPVRVSLAGAGGGAGGRDRPDGWGRGAWEQEASFVFGGARWPHGLQSSADLSSRRSPTAEFNILCDPHAADIVFNCPVKVTMVPLNITHQNLFSPADNATLLSSPAPDVVPELEPATPSPHSTGARTQLRHTLSTLLNFFASTYAAVFGFHDGPPVHDPLCVAWLSHPELFEGKRYRVDVELVGKETAGTTVVDLWEYNKAELDPSPLNWGRNGKNVFVLESVDVPAFWAVFQDCVNRADLVSPLNKPEYASA